MATRSDITPELCRQMLRYEPETGKLFWLPRPISMFTPTVCVHGVREASWSAGRWNTRYANKPAFTSVDNVGYLSGRILNVTFRAHRIVWAIVHGSWPDIVDHIDGDALNNRITNLRNVDSLGNGKNSARPLHNQSGHIGIYRRFNNWIAQINFGGKTYRIGSYDDIKDAVAARKAEERRLGFHENHGR